MSQSYGVLWLYYLLVTPPSWIFMGFKVNDQPRINREVDFSFEVGLFSPADCHLGFN